MHRVLFPRPDGGAKSTSPTKSVVCLNNQQALDVSRLDQSPSYAFNNPISHSIHPPTCHWPLEPGQCHHPSQGDPWFWCCSVRVQLERLYIIVSELCSWDASVVYAIHGVQLTMGDNKKCHSEGRGGGGGNERPTSHKSRISTLDLLCDVRSAISAYQQKDSSFCSPFVPRLISRSINSRKWISLSTAE